MATASSPAEGINPQSLKVAKVLYPASLFLEGLTAPQKVKSEGSSAESEVDVDGFIKRPIDFVTNIFRALQYPISDAAEDKRSVAFGSEKLPRSASTVVSKNFFARWLNLTGFNRRWAALPYLEDNPESGCFPIIKATQDTNALLALQQNIGQSVGNAGSAWELLQRVLSYMYMEILTVPAPPAARTTKKTGNIKSRDASGTSVGDTVPSIPTFFVKPMCTFALPPACNVIFPSMIKGYSINEDYLKQPTRLYLGEQFLSNLLTAAKKGTPVATLVSNLMVTGYPDGVKQRMKDMLSASPESSNKNFLLFAEELYKGPVSKRMNAPPWMYMLEQQEKAQSGGNYKPSAETRALVDDSIIQGMAPLGALFDTYAKYEYYRSRYAARNGGVQLGFNPYLIPGFPVAVFDERNTAVDTMGYLNTVTHTFSAANGGDMSTTMTMSFVRSMPEFVGATGNNTKGLDIMPAEVLPEVRTTLQKTRNAHNLYKRMLYRDEPMVKSAAFDWKAMLDVVRESDGHMIDTSSINDSEGKLPWFKLKPKTEFEGLFKEHDAAMRYASRPACTLREYIETWHGKSMETLLAESTVRGEYTSFYSPANDLNKEKGAVFWGRIYKLVPGTGVNPGVSVTNMGPAPEYASTGESGWSPVGPSTGLPQTREDWDVRLEEYRKIVRSEGGRIAPQD